jgi:hypothetical protein
MEPMTEHETAIPHMMKYLQWQKEFEDAVREDEPQTLRQRVDAAEAALFLRSQALSDSAPENPERQAIADAVRILRKIQREKLGYPGLE